MAPSVAAPGLCCVFDLEYWEYSLTRFYTFWEEYWLKYIFADAFVDFTTLKIKPGFYMFSSARKLIKSDQIKAVCCTTAQNIFAFIGL